MGKGDSNTHKSHTRAEFCNVDTAAIMQIKVACLGDSESLKNRAISKHDSK